MSRTANGDHKLDLRITPVPKPRMTRRDKWAKRPAVTRYFAYRDDIRAAAKGIPGRIFRVDVQFHMPFPKSWSKKRREEASRLGGLHQAKPDLDNLVKGLLDALTSEDSTVGVINAAKYWSYDRTGRVIAVIAAEEPA